MTDQKDLEVLLKALERTAATVSARQPWQEHFARKPSINQSDVLNTDIIQGFSGSWASSYGYAEGVGIDDQIFQVYGSSADVPIPIRNKTHKLGQPGFSDVDFVPYNWRTNRYGSKGPGLIGNPISYSVVGPTAKSPFTDWTWEITLGTGPNGGDLLEMTLRSDGASAVASDLNDGYDIDPFVIGDSDEPNGGLYVIITIDGSAAGSTPGTFPLRALDQFKETARYQIYRVAGVYDSGVAATNGAIELHPNKSVTDHFFIDGGSTGALRAITIIQPYVTRLVAIPGSGAATGREQTYVFVPPEKAAQSDMYPPRTTWDAGGFEPSGNLGADDSYGGKNRIPIPIPKRQVKGNLKRNAGGFQPSDLVGQMNVASGVVNGDSGDAQRVAHIYNVDINDVTPNSLTDVRQLLGWYEIFIAGEDDYSFQRVAEVDPETGQPFFGTGPIHESGTGEITLYFTIHDSIIDLWDTNFDIDQVEAVRLKHLIDPRIVERTDKLVSQNDPDFNLPNGATPARGDRAIWNTQTYNTGGGIPEADDPGSLDDLGFRVVLFPAKDNGFGQPIPDFDRPIDSRELLLDPDETESQHLDVDYSAGVVRLSHPPTIGTSDITPNGIFNAQTGSDTGNPRGEAVLFAACVPFSQEPSQLGGGPRIVCKGSKDVDVFSGLVSAGLDQGETTINSTPPFFVSEEVVLDVELTNIPETGMFDVVGTAGTTIGSFGQWGYQSHRVQDFGGGDVTVLEGVYSSFDAVEPDASTYLVTFRREVFFGERSSNFSKEIDDVRYDTVYGSALRASTLRLMGTSCKYELDGSVTVTTPGSGGTLDVEDEGGSVEPSTQTLNFTGDGVTASAVGGNKVNVTVEGSIEIQDEGGVLTPNAKFLNFIGGGVEASVNGIGVDIEVPTGAWSLMLTQTVSTVAPPRYNLTFGSLDSDNDGIYCLMGRLITTANVGAPETAIVVKPGGVNPTPSDTTYSIDDGASNLASLNANGIWRLGPDESLSTNEELVYFVQFFIYPFTKKGGASNENAGYRMGMGNICIIDSGGGVLPEGHNVWCHWLNDTSTFTFIDVVGGEFLRGTELSLYKIQV